MTTFARALKRWWLIVPIAAIVLGGCRPPPEIAIPAIKAVNAHFQACYEKTLTELGTRSFDISTQRAITAMTLALNQMDMEVVESDRSIGYLKAVGPAPRPLDEWEWRRARKCRPARDKGNPRRACWI